MKTLPSKFVLTAFSTLVISAFTPTSAFAADLMVSASATRASATLLNGRNVSGKVYIYATQETGAKQVLFYLDDPKMSRMPIMTENLAPYDFAGTASSGAANPFDASKLVAGAHNLTIRVNYTNGSYKSFSSTFNCVASPTPTPTPVATTSGELMLSLSADRSSPVALAGRSVSGNVYLYSKHDASMKQVQFYLDDSTMSRAAIKTEGAAPFDFAGTTASGTAYAYDATKLAAGTHTLTARITYTDGTTRVVNANFSRPALAVATATPAPVPTPTPTPAPTFGKKWHPGHYLNAYWGKDMASSLSRVTPYTFLKGVSVIHQWRELEPSKGVYDFSRIESELAAAKAANKQLMIQINDRTFWKSWPSCVPDYVKNDPVYKGGESHYGLKCTALRWVPAVQDRLIALYKALGKRFNNEPNFEAVFLEEDGVELRGDHMELYSARGYADQEKRGMDALSAAFPNTQVFKFLSWGPYVGELFEYAYKLGLGVGGPDLVPNEKTFASPYYPQYAGRMPLEISVQDPRVKMYIDAGGTVESLFDFGVLDPKGYNANYIIWDQPEYTTLSYKREILPMLQSHNGYINSSCPLNMDCK